MKIPKLGKKGDVSLKAIGVTLLILLLVGGLTTALVFIFKEPTIPPVPPPITPLADALTTTYNGETERNVIIVIRVRDILDPDTATINGIDIYIFAYGFSPMAMVAKGMSPNEATLLDTFTTDANGKGTSNNPFQGRTLLTAVVGLDTTTNKSQEQDFVVQGLTSATVPTSIDCGVFFYAIMLEETETAFTWTDEQGTTITYWNYTADTDKVLKARIKLVMDTSGECLRDIWNRKFGNLELMLVVKVTHYNSTSSAAIDIDNYYDDFGTPSNQLVFAIRLDEIIYEVDSTGAVEGDHDSFRYFIITLDFSGCGFPATFLNTTCTRFTIGGWCLIEENLDKPCSAGLPSGDSASWFQDVISPLNITT